MARRVEIRWTKAREQKLRKEILNFNRRVKRVQDKHPEMQLPVTLKPREVIQNIKTYQQYKNLLYDLAQGRADTFVSGKSGKTIYEEALEKRQNRRKQPGINAEQQRRIEVLKRLNPERTIGRLPTERDFLLRSIGIGRDDTPSEILQKVERWLQGNNFNRSSQWRDNYLKTIEQHMEIASLADNNEALEDLEKLYKLISQMDLRDFLIGQLVNNAQLSIGQAFYGPNADVGYDSLIEAWREIL